MTVYVKSLRNLFPDITYLVVGSDKYIIHESGRTTRR